MAGVAITRGATQRYWMLRKVLCLALSGLWFLPFLQRASFFAAILMLLLEASAGILTLLPKTRRIGVILSLTMGSMFLAVNLIRFAEDIPVPCSCFGAIYKASPAAIVLIDLGIIGASWFLLSSFQKEVST